jgi:hypothetical protein
VRLKQQALIAESDPEAAIPEKLLPDLWVLAEGLADPDDEKRLEALQDPLLQSSARRSPLIAQMLVARLFDQGASNRSVAIKLLAKVLDRDEKGEYPPARVRSAVLQALTQFGPTVISTLVLAAVEDNSSADAVGTLVNVIPNAGKVLKEIASDRGQAIELREGAIILIGKIGFIDAVQELERIRNRIESRMNGQRMMPFAPPAREDEEKLLPEIRKVLSSIQI